MLLKPELNLLSDPVQFKTPALGLRIVAHLMVPCQGQIQLGQGLLVHANGLESDFHIIKGLNTWSWMAGTGAIEPPCILGFGLWGSFGNLGNFLGF